jgi:two-component system CheB/CheR fusion protein
MAMAAVPDMGRYIELLRKTEDEADQLARDLLIHVTGFFRDPKVFEFLAEHTIPELIRNHAADQPLRIWVAGCSTGEETYSLAILFQEEIAATKSGVKLQVFASDVDPAAVVKEREGL